MIRVTEDDGSQWVDAETFDEVLAALKGLLAASQVTEWGDAMAGEVPAARAAIARAEGTDAPAHD